MRINGYGDGSFFGYPKQESSGQKKFRNRYRIGDLIRGSILNYETRDKAWVRIDDLTLLAQLKTQYARGTYVHFIVTALHPEILLQEAIKGPDGYGPGLHLVV